MDNKPPEEVQEQYFKGQKILKKGEQYYCSECHHEIPVTKSCPICHTRLDWDRIFMEIHK